MKIVRPITVENAAEFTRASTGTYFDSAGVLQTAAIDEPRWNYDPADLTQPPQLLLEEAATNLALWSEDLSNAAWTKTRCSIVTNQVLAPDGNLTMAKVVEDTSDNTHGVQRAQSVTIGTLYAVSIFAKAAERRWIRVNVPLSHWGTAYLAYFDLLNGVLGTVAAGATATIEDIGDGIYRCTLMPPPAISTGPALIPVCHLAIDNNDISYQGDGSSGLYAWGAEIKTGSASSYIKTTSASVTRAADVMPMMVSDVPENDYAAWSSGTTYALADRAIYVSGVNHWVVESLQAGNTNHVPTGLESDTWWLKVGNTNRWKAFDGAIQSQTSQAEWINMVLRSATSRVDSVALFNIDCASARVTVTDTADGLVYDQTVSLVSNSGITDWYAYFFEPITRITDYVFTELPPYLNATIGVALIAAGGTALCGACVLGLSREIGGTQYGASAGIQDYSIKTQDAFGNYTVLERAYNKRANFQIMVANSLIDELQTILAGYRAVPVVYVGTDLYASTMVYGFYKDFSVVISYPTTSILSIELEGLT